MATEEKLTSGGGTEPYHEACKDKQTGLRFLVDSGADVSLIPAKSEDKKQAELKLYAANGTKIDTYGTKLLEIDLGLRRDFTFPFIIAKIDKGILGADFLNEFNLLIDIQGKKIIDANTKLAVKGQISAISEEFIVSATNNTDAITRLISKYRNLCTPNLVPAKLLHKVEHQITTTGPPVFSKARQLDTKRLRIAKQEFQYMLENDIIRPSKSQRASPLHMTLKKDGTYRSSGDYHRLNNITIPDLYPIPRFEDFHHILRGKQLFSRIDLFKAYYQIPIAEEDKEKTAVITPFGLFEFNVMSFGLRNAPATFQRFINEVLFGLDFVFPYIDDILIASTNKEEHETHLEMIFERLSKHDLRINANKSKFGVQEVEFLGHQTTKEGSRPLTSKTKAVQEYKLPETIRDLQTFLASSRKFGLKYPFLDFFRKPLGPKIFLVAVVTAFSTLTSANSAKRSMKKTRSNTTMIEQTHNQVPQEPTTDSTVAASLRTLTHCLDQLLNPSSNPKDRLGLQVSTRPQQRRAREKPSNASFGSRTPPKLNEPTCTLNQHTPVISLRPYRTPYAYQKEIQDQISQLLKHDIITPSSSPYSSPVTLVRKRDNTMRLCIDFRAVNVYHKFIPEYARLRHPLNQLLKKNAKWLWSPNCQQAFDKLKQHLATQPVLHLFQEGLPCQVYCDASTQGIAGVLKQVHPDGNIYPVQYYSRALRSYERNYTISELECLVIVECVDKFRVYLLGTKFVIYSDHHALQWLKTIKDPTGRLFRWSLRLSAYDYEVKYLKGSRQYEADLLSRNPFCGFLSTGQIKDHQGELRRDTRYILNDKDLMTITRRGVTKIIVPQSLRGTLLQRAHRDFNHPGISQMTRLIAAQYYWDGMTNDIRTHVRTCSVCQLVKPPKGPIYGELGQLPPAVLPYELVSLDTISGFAKYGNSQTFLHVVVDHATRYAWAFPSRSTSILTYTQVIKKVMQFGSPKRLLTDRAPAFTSPKFRRFLIRHNNGQLLTTSNNPQANGLSERLNATITGKLKLLRLQQPKTAWTKLLPQVLQAYNHTPHSVTGFPLSYLLLGSYPVQLSEHVQNYPKIDDARGLAYQRTHERHLRDKARFDQTHRASDFEVGDLVLAKTYHHPDTGKLAPFFSGPYEILEIISPQIVRINRSNRPLSRETDTIHVNKLKHYTENEQFISPPLNDRDQPKNTFNFPYKHFNHTLIHTKTAINSRKQHDYTYNQDDQRYLNRLSPEIFTNY
ncbi:hypothetical protein LAZ67_19001571 [Cordylochernes scorpioides]|uniref:RNA-directed DNA polymerase n=1 Tax=Cordylochernes scorpioides TaxID=51811 RepID=A0ABY6LI46_9ARAC|nr:hypothetical protein LAZ67_19001571 [Cordylochernes scorpioides]